MVDVQKLEERFERDHEQLNKLTKVMIQIETWKAITEKFVDTMSKELREVQKTIYKSLGAMMLAQIILLPIIFFFLFRFFK